MNFKNAKWDPKFGTEFDEASKLHELLEGKKSKWVIKAINTLTPFSTAETYALTHGIEAADDYAKKKGFRSRSMSELKELFKPVSREHKQKKKKSNKRRFEDIPKGKNHNTDVLSQSIGSSKDVAGEVRRNIPIPRRVQELAIITATAYANTTNDRISGYNERMLQIGSVDLSTFIYQESASSRQIAVYEEKQTGNIFSAFRGTKDVMDLATDVYIILNIENLSLEFRKMNSYWNKIYETWPTRKHILTGHSLGGAFATYVENKNPSKVYKVFTFNMGSSLGAIRAGLKGTSFDPSDPKITNYFIKGDPLSMLGRLNHGENNIVYPAKPGLGNPHTIAQFIDPKFELPSEAVDAAKSKTNEETIRPRVKRRRKK